MKIKKLCKILALLLIFSNSIASAEIFFSGYTGAKANFNLGKKSESVDPELELESYFAGQFNFSENIIGHAEFSLKTFDLIENSIFKATDSKFQIDEISVVFRSKGLNSTNYFSIFMGTYEPIGSDIFLRRQFGIQPIMSKITESWLGIAGSVIYPLFGIGIADVIHFSNQPLALGIYTYFNQELDDSFYIFNADLRFAGVYRFFTFDLSAGIGTPLQKQSTSDSLLIIKKIYWRVGMNMLVGNAYTNSLFMQAGISDVPFSKAEAEFEFDPNKTYILFEPRFRTSKFQLDITAFSLPQDTVNDFIFINDTLGINFNVFTDNLYFKNKMFLFGINTALSFPEKTFMDFEDPASLFDDYTITIAPYVETKFYNGEIHTMMQARISDLIKGNWHSAFELNIGFKTQL